MDDLHPIRVISSNHHAMSQRAISKLVSGVDDDCDGTVVDEVHLHIGSELPRFYVETILLTETVVEVLIQRQCLLGAGGLDKRRTVAMTHIAIECELRDRQNGTIDFLDTQVHLALCVLKNTQLCHFLGDIIGIGLRVGVGDAHQKHETLVNMSHDIAVNADGGMGGALYDNSHIVSLFEFQILCKDSVFGANRQREMFFNSDSVGLVRQYGILYIILHAPA